MMDVTKLIMVGNHFTMCVRQLIVQYTLNLHSAVCQLYISIKLEKIKKF